MGVSNTLPPAKLVVHKANRQSVVKPQFGEGDAGSTSLNSASAAVPQQTLLSTARDATDTSSRTAAGTANFITTTTPLRRRVHFHVNDGDDQSATSTTLSPLTRIIHTIPSTCDMDEYDRAQLWWTKEERRDILERNQTIVEDYVHRHAHHVSHLQQVFRDECCTYETAVVTSDDDTASSTSLSSSSSSEDSSDDDEEIVSSKSRKRGRHPTSRLHALCYKRQRHSQHNNKMHLPTSVRGLEYGILPDAKSHRKVHRQRVLDWQDRIKKTQQQMNTTGCDDYVDEKEHMATVLEHQSLLSSQRSRKLAQLLAASDASMGEENGGRFVPSGTSSLIMPLSKRLMYSMSNSYRYGVSLQARPRMW